MKFKNKASQFLYALLCVVLTAGLIFGIYFIVNVGEKYQSSSMGIIGGSDNPTDIFIDAQTSSHSESDIIDTYEYKDGAQIQQLSTHATSYEIDIPYGSVTIKPTDRDEPYVVYSSKRALEIQTREDEGECKLKVVAHDKGINLFDFDQDRVKIEFYLPKGKLQELDVNFDAGMLKITGIKAVSFSLDMSAGNAKVEDCEFDRIQTDLAAGNLEVYAYDRTTSIESDVAAGNMKLMIPQDISGFDVRYSIDLGNITNNLSLNNVSSSSQGYVFNRDGKMSYGDKSCKIELDVALGNISLNEY